MAAKEQWLSGDIALARDTLANAFNANADSENIFLAAFKLEFENDELERARFILDKARASDSSSTQRVWMKSAIVERELGDALAEARVLKEGLVKFPYFDKLWLMLGQLEERQSKLDAARQVCCCYCLFCVYSRIGSALSEADVYHTKLCQDYTAMLMSQTMQCAVAERSQHELPMHAYAAD